MREPMRRAARVDRDLRLLCTYTGTLAWRGVGVPVDQIVTVKYADTAPNLYGHACGNRIAAAHRTPWTSLIRARGGDARGSRIRLYEQRGRSEA